MSGDSWTAEDSFEARLAYVMESDDYPQSGCYRTPNCPCAPCEQERTGPGAEAKRARDAAWYLRNRSRNDS